MRLPTLGNVQAGRFWGRVAKTSAGITIVAAAIGIAGPRGAAPWWWFCVLGVVSWSVWLGAALLQRRSHIAELSCSGISAAARDIASSDREIAAGHDVPSDPRALAARIALADAYWSARDHCSALDLYESALIDGVRYLGSDHPLSWTAWIRLRESRQGTPFSDARGGIRPFPKVRHYLWLFTRRPRIPRRIVDMEARIGFVPPYGWTPSTPPPRSKGVTVLCHRYLPGLILVGGYPETECVERDDARVIDRLTDYLKAVYVAPGRCVDTETRVLRGPGTYGRSSFFRLVFDSDVGAVTGEVYIAVVRAGTRSWFVGWLSDSGAPIDIEDAENLARSLRPITLPPRSEHVPSPDLPRPTDLTQISGLFHDHEPISRDEG
ncbi:APA family fibronectin-binding glycoprotein [Nocardia paucivorans]|uniref:APA family fibronectin-binding glycoprotein n=1 Tax=Nocardia paucivorans TaxID=114259 RepID=UPI0012FC2C68|nr:APA family fibronectin-binding glycoprotein [Nocardia paucivorans]